MATTEEKRFDNIWCRQKNNDGTTLRYITHSIYSSFTNISRPHFHRWITTITEANQWANVLSDFIYINETFDYLAVIVFLFLRIFLCNLHLPKKRTCHKRN
jgi:hypothetical protein